MTHLLIDTSVLIKWFHAEGEVEVGPARSLRDAHVAGDVDAHVLDLATYELGNVLVRSLGWDEPTSTAQLEDLDALVGPPLPLGPDARSLAVGLATRHQLTFCDAAWAAVAQDLGVVLVSADRPLLSAGLARSPTETAARLGLT